MNCWNARRAKIRTGRPDYTRQDRKGFTLSMARILNKRRVGKGFSNFRIGIVMFYVSDRIKGFDDELWDAIQGECKRQEEHVELIASENYTSPRVLEAQGSVLTNKYAEGYPGKRYYGGCEFVDIAEQLAIDRAKQLFDATYVNVQPHSGSGLMRQFIWRCLIRVTQFSV
ncbi:MAG: hypothetical protein CM1200mP41_06900 [Gammaproteobacteria bacterium]|nr:MAG: hypothetical protein CM1200mP41_06900 [Gammaproteobacteria bacterium]